MTLKDNRRVKRSRARSMWRPQNERDSRPPGGFRVANTKYPPVAAAERSCTASHAAASDGTAAIKLTPMEFMERLAALVPRPRVHLTRFHGVLGPHYKYRKDIEKI